MNTVNDSGQKERWSDVESYFADLLLAPDPALDAALEASAAAGLPLIQVSPLQGKLLNLLARVVKARAILEVGTLGGYSTIWLARALAADGFLISLEVNTAHARVAQTNISRAGLAQKVEVRVGPALELLPRISEKGEGPFDMIFIDANKEDTAEYFDWALRLSHRGSLIIVDNVVRHGEVIDAESDDFRVIGMRRFAERLAAEPRVSSTVVQTVSSKAYDGFAVALVVE